VARHFNILCVDDEHIALTMRTRMLASAGYVILASETPLRAIELFRANTVDLVITDDLLSEITGSNLARELRRLDPNLPIIFLSSEWTTRKVMTPPDYFFHKLEGPAEMIAKVRSILPPPK
jgi:CheY-like chemotaxis protein